MDWSRAKTILILAFFGLNLFLGVELWLNEEYGVSFVLASDVEDAKAELKEQNIEVTAPLPTRTGALPFLQVGYEKLDPGSIMKDLPPAQVTPTGEIEYKKGDNEDLRITPKGQISYMLAGGEKPAGQVEPLYPDLTPEQARKIAEQFIAAHGGLPPGARFERAARLEVVNGFLVEFSQEYKGYVLTQGYIRVLVTENGVQSYWRYWLKPKGFVGKKNPTLPIANILLRVGENLPPRKDNEKIIITRIEPAYASEDYNAEEWLMAPVWRIQYKKEGDKAEDSFPEELYINAITGERER